MKFLFLGQVLSFIGRKLDGYKTLIGGIGLILMGIVGLINLTFDMGWVEWSLEISLGFITTGFAALGIGGKIEKLTRVEKERG